MVYDVNVVPSLLAILGVIVSFLVAGIAVWLGWHSNSSLYKTRKLDKKKELIKEIVDWAEGITVFVSKQIVSDRTTPAIIMNSAADRLKELNVLAAKGIYIESLVSGILPDNTVLLAAIKKLRVLINEHTSVVTIVVTARDNKEKDLLEVLEEWLGDEEESAVKVRDDAIELIKLVAPIYTEIK